MALYWCHLSSNIEYMVINGEDMPSILHPQSQSYYLDALIVLHAFRCRQALS